MGAKTGIEWTESTWNPVSGCTEVSPGCDHCYAKSVAERFRGTPGHYYEHGFDVTLREDKLELPLRWSKPRRIFVNSMSDLFHDSVPDEYIAKVFAVMALASQHTFQLLTKRHGRMRSLLHDDTFRERVVWEATGLSHYATADDVTWPLPNLWLGVSVENQQWADIRIPALLGTPAAVRFLSMEPLLGPVDLQHWVDPERECSCMVPRMDGAGQHSPLCRCLTQPEIGWVIVGGESGRGARPMHPDWVRSLRDQCANAGVPFLFKQWGEWAPFGPDYLPGTKDDFRMRPDGSGEFYSQRNRPGIEHMVRVGKKAAGRELDERTWDEYPGGQS